jgi:MFS family permease
MKNLFRLNRNVIVLSWTSLLNDIASEIIYPLLPVFLKTVLGVSTAFIGLVEGVAESTASVLKVVSGWFSDKIRKRKSLTVAGYALSTFARPLIALAAAGWHVLLIRFLDRVGKGVRTSPRDALIAESTPPEELGKAFGFHRSMDHLGAVIGPLIAFALLSALNNDYRTLFLLASIPGVFAVSLVLLFVKEKRATVQNTSLGKAQQTQPLSLKNLNANFKASLIAVGIFALGNSSDAFLLLRAKSLGVNDAFLPLLWVVLHIVKALSAFPFGIVSDKVGRKRTIVSGWVLYGLVYLGFGFAQTEWQMWLLFSLYGIYFGLTEGVEKALIAEIVPAEGKATAFGVYHFVIGVAAFPASLLFGLCWDWFGVTAAFLLGATLALIAGIYFISFVKEPRIQQALS